MTPETNAVCTQCTAHIYAEDAVYDDRAQHYFCSSDCFRDWADDNFDIITEYYERMNVN